MGQSLVCCGPRDSSYIADDIFFEVDEGDSRHDAMFSSVTRQPSFRRGSAVVTYGYTVCSRRSHIRSAVVPVLRRNSTPRIWFGSTIPKSGDLQPSGPCWSPGDGSGLRLRCGPEFRINEKKCESNGCLYECISLDFVTSNVKIGGALEHGVLPLPSGNGSLPPDCAAGSLQWRPGCTLPRIICVNTQLPYGPANPQGDEGPGCSIIAMFRIKAETLHMLEKSDTRTSGFQNFMKFCEGPMGKPGCQEPARCLHSRRNLNNRPKFDAGLFKAVATVENWDEIGLPQRLETYNGKPCLITKSGSIVRGPMGEWVEIDVDLRQFAWLARSSLWHFRQRLPLARLHIGFLIQGVSDDELPEGLIGDVHVNHLDMMLHPQHIETQ